MRSLALQALLAWQRATAATAELADAQGFSARWLVMVELVAVAVSVVTATTVLWVRLESPTRTQRLARSAQRVRTVALAVTVDAEGTQASVETAVAGRFSASILSESLARQVTQVSAVTQATALTVVSAATAHRARREPLATTAPRRIPTARRVAMVWPAAQVVQAVTEASAVKVALEALTVRAEAQTAAMTASTAMAQSVETVALAELAALAATVS